MATILHFPWALSAACEGSVCRCKGESKKERALSVKLHCKFSCSSTTDAFVLQCVLCNCALSVSCHSNPLSFKSITHTHTHGDDVCIDVCIIGALLTSHATAELEPQQSLNVVKADNWTEALDELATCYRQPGKTITTNKPGLTSFIVFYAHFLST